MLTNAELFQLASAAVLPGWLALATAPLWRHRAILVARVIAALLAGFYVVLLNLGLLESGLPDGAGFTSLEAVRILLASEAALLAGWVHYLAFDLWVGSWQAQDAAEIGLPHALLVPCLVFTFVAGPAGLLLYLLLRTGRLHGQKP